MLLTFRLMSLRTKDAQRNGGFLLASYNFLYIYLGDISDKRIHLWLVLPLKL